MDNTPLILTGPPGCGKSQWIQEYAEKTNRELLVCPCRKDRTLREGRQKLHIWARRAGAAILWLEGADDLTPEAQAFLRRILETHAHEVLFILECRDSGKLQEPIRSRCRIQRIHKPSWIQLENHFETTPEMKKQARNYLCSNDYSFRRVQQIEFLQTEYPEIWKQIYETRMKEKELSVNATDTDIPVYIENAYNPEILLEPFINTSIKAYGACLDNAGSLWALLSNALYNARTVPNVERET
jgi:DNA polymerase III delta prime subunit